MKTTYDIVVAGGGLTGVGAAVVAARRGAKVLLIEGSGCLGGAVSQNLVYPFMRYFTWNDDGNKRTNIFLSCGIFREFCNRLEQMGALNNYWNFNPEYVKVLLDEMAVEAGVELLFHAQICGVNKHERKITSVVASTKAGLMEFGARMFIDCTGDGDVMALSGCEYTIGRAKDNLCQPMTLCFRVTGVDDELLGIQAKDFTPLYNEHQKCGKIKNIREDILYFRGLGKGVVHFNSTRVVKLNPVDPFDVSKAEIMARTQMVELYEFLKANFSCFENSTLSYSAVSIGVRESRKLVGEYVVTAEDLLSCKVFDDSVACADYDIDIHNPEGSGTSHHFFEPGTYYTIPYRSLVAKEYDNLLVSGRCLSATHEAQASIRIMPTCMCLGEAAGLAAYLCVADGCAAKQVDMDKLHKVLCENGAKYK